MGSKSRQASLPIQGVAVLPQGLEDIGSQELQALGAKQITPRRRAASFASDMACFYRLHLQCRLPFRLLREMARFHCDGRDSLYDGVQQALDWERWLHPSMSFRVDVTGTAPGLNHSHFTALQVKNALIDRQRDLWGQRSSIDLNEPDLCLHVHLHRGEAILSLDGSGGSLHRRGYRAAVGVAPLKENLAAGLIRLTGWDGSTPLTDPCCGSGTLLIEATAIALQRFPALHRRFLLESWADFEADLWDAEQRRAHKRQQPTNKAPRILGYEQDAKIAQQARDNISAAGLEEVIEIVQADFRDAPAPEEDHGVVVCNPPYGVRLGDSSELQELYRELGAVLKKDYGGWDLWLLSGNRELTAALRLKAKRRIPVSNGGLDCRWLHYELNRPSADPIPQEN
ncbi:class I SAM-dependent RNA methyltransferase [Synechococcus sp. MIT S9504]|uniref:THUMP domain-containing class I SAM-dependent RNA methyltransferase n=1 Tax=Synechococcus sp. MIT S9504 TaxID=1801628 RepID=UPI000829ED69|nr:THUMP domain-containing protein [Synechococcus sp. MIT S9504]